MNADGLFNVAAAIVTVALVTTIVSSPRTADIIRAIGDSFSDSISASMGK